MERKELLRQQMRIRRQQFYNQINKKKIFQQLHHNLLTVISSYPQQIIGGYWSTGSEVPLGDLLTTLYEQGYPITLPVALSPDQPLGFRQWSPSLPLIKDITGTFCPLDSQPYLQPSLLFVPLLAFNQKGERLGQGGGFYDRTIRFLRQESKSLLTIGVAYEMQKCSTLVTEPHDEPLDMIVTEQRIYSFH